MINMTPPVAPRDDFFTRKLRKSLRLQNTGELFFMDEQDWQKAKHILWWWHEGQPVTKRGMPFAEYVGLKAERRTIDVDTYDFRRATYGDA